MNHRFASIGKQGTAWKAFALGALLAWGSSAQAQTTLYSLSSTALDGSTGENTYLLANTNSTATLGYNNATPSMTLAMPSGYGFILANFTSTTLSNVGDSLSFSFSYTPTVGSISTSGSGALRVGFLNSGGSLVSSNSATSGDALVQNDTGYAAEFGTTANSGNSFYKRNSGSGSNYSGPIASTNASQYAGAPQNTTITTGAVTGNLTLTLTSTGVQISTKIGNGSTVSYTDTASSTTTFDEVALFLLPAGTATFSITDFTVNFTAAAVPEPSTYLLLLSGLLGLALIQRLRGEKQAPSDA